MGHFWDSSWSPPLGWFEHGSPLENAQHLARWFCSWFLVYDLLGVRGTCLPSIYVKKDEVMDSVWKNTRIQKTVLFWGFFCFSMEDHPMVKRRPREDQRLRERGRGMKKERTMWRCRNATRFRTGWLLQKTIGTRMFTQKERRYLCVDWLCWDCRLHYYSSEDVGNFWMNMLSLGGAHTW